MKTINKKIEEAIYNQAIPDGKLPFWNEFLIDDAVHGKIKDCYNFSDYIYFIDYMKSLYKLGFKYRMITRNYPFETFVKKHSLECYEKLKHMSENFELFTLVNKHNDFDDDTEDDSEDEEELEDEEIISEDEDE